MSEAGRMTELKENKKWKLFHATDFISLVYPCYFIANIFGIFPFKCASSGYTFSRIRVIYSMTILATFLIAVFYMVHEIDLTSPASSTLPRKLYQSSYLIMCGNAVLLTYGQHKAILRFLQELTEASSMVAPKDFNDMAIFVHSKDIFVFLFLSSHVFNCFKNGFTFMTVKNFTALFMVLVNFIMDMFYINSACVLKACFMKINEDLDKLRKPITKTFLRHKQRTASLLMKLKNLEGKYLQVTDILQLLNKIFMTLLIVTAVKTFIVVTFDLYFCLVRVSGGEIGRKNLHFWYWPYIPPIVYNFLKFVTLIWACETATNKAKEIRTTLHDALSGATDLSVKRELELFSLQLLHCDTTFSAKIFDMNASLLAEVVGGIIMYLLILLQFLLNWIVCEAKQE
nr:uncharacterized protein LOC117610888 isoform X1 [Osmia lignaria]XP_034194622.1 uncharacterized protein LOC117610888 isoform X1 [Osmia lignaria]XP_034194623.1 uncharacterized protein LOC117610888 isoform X1 [Osmia lignaria]XP_034194624.1 uncharacterized protein LOC117610888 isoform X1 [Osmia lignaria]